MLLSTSPIKFRPWSDGTTCIYDSSELYDARNWEYYKLLKWRPRDLQNLIKVVHVIYNENYNSCRFAEQYLYRVLLKNTTSYDVEHILLIFHIALLCRCPFSRSRLTSAMIHTPIFEHLHWRRHWFQLWIACICYDTPSIFRNCINSDIDSNYE